MSFLARFFGLVLSVTLGIGQADAQTPRVDQVSILEAGIYELGPSNSLQFVRSSTEVPGQVGVRFGFRYVVRGPESALPIEILLVTRLPQRLGQIDPATGQRRFRVEEFAKVRVGGTNVSGYSFDAAWEVVLGEWVFEIWAAGLKRAEQRFNVVRP